MKLVRVTRKEFSLWTQFRSEINPLLSREYDLKEIENIYSNESWRCWSIEREDGEKIGLVELSLRNIVDGSLSSPVPYLEGFCLLPSERGKGRGTEVMEIIKLWCRDHGYTELATDAELANIPAQEFYEKLGFEQVDKVVEYRIDINKT